MLPLLQLNKRNLQSIYLTLCILASIYLAQETPTPTPSPSQFPSNYTSFNFTSIFTDNTRTCSDPSRYCSPLASDIWRLNDKHLLIWKYLFPEYAVSSYVDLKVYLVENPRDPVAEHLNLQNRNGKFSFSFTSDLFYKFDPNAKVEQGFNYIKKQAYYVVTPAGSVNQVPSQSPYFAVVDTEPPGLPTTTTPSSPTPTPTPTPTQTPSPIATPTPTPTSESSNTSLPPYSIALIVIASLTGLVTVGTIIYVLLSKRNEAPPAVAGAATGGHLEKGGGPSGVIALDNNVDNSSKPNGAMVISSRDSSQTQNSTTPLAPNTNLSSTDAQMLSETFRNMMRKPSWTTDQQQYPTNLAKQRLEEELEREGVGLQDIQPKKLTIQTESDESPIQPPPPSRPPNP